MEVDRPRSSSSAYPGGRVTMTGPERLPELRDVHLDCVRGRIRRFPGPERLHEPVGGDDAAEVEREHREQRPRLRAPERDDAAVLHRLERPEQA